MKFPAHEPFADTDCDVRRGTLHRARPSATEQRQVGTRQKKEAQQGKSVHLSADPT